MRSQEFYYAMVQAYTDLRFSDPVYNEFLIVETCRIPSRGYTVVSRSHYHNVVWTVQPKILYSTKEGSFSFLI
jgi:hypothetical protein